MRAEAPANHPMDRWAAALDHEGRGGMVRDPALLAPANRPTHAVGVAGVWSGRNAQSLRWTRERVRSQPGFGISTAARGARVAGRGVVRFPPGVATGAVCGPRRPERRVR
jgi:hypothetical protein